MRRCGAGLIAAVFVLCGCKSTDSKPTDKDAAGTPASRTKGSDGKLPDWLQPAGSQPGWSDPGNPRDPSAQDFVGGRVLDPSNHPIADVFIQVELVNPPSGTPANVGIKTDQNGVFYTRGLKPGRTYNLTADTTLNNRQYTASVQTAIPKMNITMVLRDDQVPNTRGPAGGTFPPQPSPFDPNSDHIPPGLGPPIPKPTDGAWSPGTDPMRPVPATTAPSTTTSPTGTIPPPDLSSPPRPVSRPENVADRPVPWVAPPANIPGSQSLPNYPNPPPPSPSPPNQSQGMSGAVRGFFLKDTQGHDWEFPANKSGSVVVAVFMTTTCPFSKKAMPVLADLQSRYAIAGLQVIAVACDEPTAEKPRMDQQQRSEAAAQYARNNNLNFQIFVEPGPVSGGVRDRYNVQMYPTAIVLSGTGTVLWQGNPYKQPTDLEAAIKKALGK